MVFCKLYFIRVFIKIYAYHSILAIILTNGNDDAGNDDTAAAADDDDGDNDDDNDIANGFDDDCDGDWQR